MLAVLCVHTIVSSHSEAIEYEWPCNFHYFPYIQRMMKLAERVKTLEVRAVDAVRDLLDDLPSVKVESVEYEHKVGRAYGVDGLIGLSFPGGSYALVVEVKSNGAPRFVRSGVYQLESYVARLRRSGEANGGRRFVPMLVSHYLSPASRAICTEHDVAYLDLVGNARLAFDTVYIERTVADKPRAETRALRSIFTPKAAAILRVLLDDPDRAWRVADLAAQAKASFGHVSNVRKALLERNGSRIGMTVAFSSSRTPCCKRGARTIAARPANRLLDTPIFMEGTLMSGCGGSSTLTLTSRVRSTRWTLLRGGLRPSAGAVPSRSTPTNAASRCAERRVKADSCGQGNECSFARPDR